ncbi:HRDC domain-containing protein [uncultured Flavobacterium sp.]|uniref:HRDC domain-containing protein n=1 Tax=uncultured Flavobacterium sp. TaxID=165435 RepID=UPI0030EF0939|tara:strand:+ start:57433 stop:57876 length:444 start_codon:yes stop_codon:yes gene_type:complete
MNIRVFNIRLSKEFCIVDQNRMNEFLDSVEVKLTSTNFVTTGSADYWSAVVFYDLKNKIDKSSKEVKSTFEDLSEHEKEIFSSLKQWRNDLARDLSWSAFRICHNAHLLAIVEAKPETLEELAKVKGFGEVRTEKYGEDILAVLNAF